MEHLVSLLIFFPAFAALLALALQSNFRAYGIVISALEFALSLWLFASFDPTQGNVQFLEAYALVPSMGITYLVGVDGISLALVLLSTFMVFVGFVWLPTHTQQKELVVCLLLLETILIGIFCVFDAILFYMFWELSLLPLVYMLGIWGGREKIYAAMKFFIYVFAASMIMLIGILYVGYQYSIASGYWSFSLLDWENLSLGIATQTWLFWLFFIGFAVKIPMLPFHTWLPHVHGQNPTIGDFAAVLLKIGAYGFLRFNLPLFPDASVMFLTPVALISVVMVIYGALVAYHQNDMKQIIAYSSISHMGIVVLGIFAFNAQGIGGGVFLMASHVIVGAALFLFVGILYERKQSYLLADMGGLAKAMPLCTLGFGVMLMASVGLPLTSTFVGEFLSLLGFFAISPVFTLVALSTFVLGALYMLMLFTRAFLGSTPARNLAVTDLNTKERCSIALLVLVVVWLGINPNPILKPLDSSVSNLLEKMERKARDTETILFIQGASNA